MIARLALPAAALAALAALAPPALAQSGGGFDLSWSAVTAGGGLSSQGGGFELGGTLGQGAAAGSSGGAFTLTGGFWNTGTLGTTAVPGPPPSPSRFALHAPVPNPVADRTTIAFELAVSSEARLEIFDVVGHRVRRLAEAPLAAGPQRVTWDGRDEGGARVPDGIYFAQLAAGPSRASVRIVVLH